MPKLSSSPDTSKKAFDGTSPASQYARGTLSVTSPTPRHRSLPGSQEGQPSPAPARTSFSSRKRLDPSDPSTWTSRHTPSFDERPRAASETLSRANVPDIRLPTDASKSSGNDSGGINLDGSGAAQSGAITSPSESQKSPVASSAVPNSPAVKHAAPSGAAGSSLSPTTTNNDQTEDRRFSNQSASFSSVTTDSDRIGRISGDSERDDEHAVQESSGSSDSDSSSSEQEEELPVSERGRQRESSRDVKPPEGQDTEPSAKVLAEPEIRGMC